MVEIEGRSTEGLQFDLHNPYSMSKLSRAVRRKDMREVKRLLAEGSNPNVVDNRCYTALHEASRSDDLVEIARVLLDAGAFIEHRTIDGQSPLFLACSSSCEAIVKLYLSRNCLVNSANIDCITPLHEACGRGNANIVKELIEAGANIDARDREGMTPIYYAIQSRSAEVAKILIDESCKMDINDFFNRSPLQFSCIVGDLGIFDILVERMGLSKELINKQTSDGWTLLMEAVQFKHFPIAKKLIDYGADTSLVDARGLLALHLAAHSGLTDCFDLVIRNTPKDVIERYSIPRDDLRCTRSLPCLLIDSDMFDGLQLLLDYGLSDEVLTCPTQMGDKLVPPVAFLLLYGANVKAEDKVKYLELLLTKDALRDPIRSVLTMRSVEAAVRSHRTSHQNCNCDILLAMLLNEGVSPDYPLLAEISQPLACALDACFFRGLGLLLAHSNNFEPEDLLRYLFSLFESTEYEISEKDHEKVKFLVWACSDLRSVITDLSRSMSTAPPDRVPKIIPLLDAVKTKLLQLPSLKLICRRVIRTQVRKCNPEVDLRSSLKSLILPRAITDFLLHEELLTYPCDQ